MTDLEDKAKELKEKGKNQILAWIEHNPWPVLAGAAVLSFIAGLALYRWQ